MGRAKVSLHSERALKHIGDRNLNEQDIEEIVERKVEERLLEEHRDEAGHTSESGSSFSRRNFLKMLGLGTGGLALSSLVSADIFKLTPKPEKSTINADQLDGNDASDLGGVNYIQGSEPSSPSSGETWLDTDTNQFYVYYDAGSGADWHPIPPVRVLEEASTFTESGVKVTLTETSIANGSIELADPVLVDDAEDGDITNMPSLKYSAWTGDTGELLAQTGTVLSGSYSLEFHTNPNGSYIVNADRDNEQPFSLKGLINGNASTGEIDDRQGVSLYSTVAGTELARFSVRGDGEVTFNGGSTSSYPTHSGGTNSFRFRVDYANSQVTFVWNGNDVDTKSMDSSIAGFDRIRLIGDSNFGSGSEITYYVDDLQEFSSGGGSGEALIEWNSGLPGDISSWDLATFQRTLDGETVTIDVEDGNGNVLFSDIDQNFDISTVSTSKNVKLRVNLSRSNTSNNPTLDYVARRYVR